METILKQFYELKDKYPGSLLMFRRGDFYELYGNDAVFAAQILGLVVGTMNDNPMKFCCFPFHALDTYLPKLVKAGKRIAIVDCIEEPKQEQKDVDFSLFHPVEDMREVTHIFKKIFDGKKSFGTDNAKMGFFHEQMLAAKVDGNQIIFALPFNGPMKTLREILENTHYNKTNSIMVKCDVNEENTILTAKFYSKEYKIFTDL